MKNLIFNKKTINYFIKTKFSKEELVEVLIGAISYIQMIDSKRGSIHFSGIREFNLGGWKEHNDF